MLNTSKINSRRRLLPLLILLPAVCAPLAGVHAQDTQTQYLSGHDKDDAVPWDFFCTAGKQGNRWTTIPVPSQWEFHGFGKLSYGVDMGRGPIVPVEGRYRRHFRTPTNWQGQRTFLVFEGSMTDTKVTINGHSAGPAHQGGYYQFRYEITELIKPGQDNLLEVTVDDESTDASINNAERRGDYWNYGGIYRPVYLESVPTEFIKRIAIDAQAGGALAIDVFGDAIAAADHVQARVFDLKGHPIGNVFSQPISAAQQNVTLKSQIQAPRLWTAETPNLYQLEVRLMRGKTVVHRIKRRFGFRTIELRAGDGIYVNGKRVLLKGANRHSFWPDSGRCISDKISRMDIGLMKDMNMNTVRMSHYPPDQHFLDDCDKMGLYVLDELAGWQHKYDTPIGKKLVEEMVTRDVNHPSILFWDNANEGGWNTDLDSEFARWDPQQRQVIHPGGTISAINDDHYPTYDRIEKLASGNKVFMPTEFLHGLYDGGAGAGLADYWDAIRGSKVGGGGIIWALLDETVKRTDLDGRLDTRGNLAPDGILGPYREKEGSYDAIKEIWSPIAIREKQLPADFAGALTIENRYDFLDARECRYNWTLRNFAHPGDTNTGDTVLYRGTARLSKSVPPGTSGILQIDLPQNWRQAEALSLTVNDPQGHTIRSWTWPLPHAADFRAITAAKGADHAQASETTGRITVRCGDLMVAFSKVNGQLVTAERKGQKFSLINGPRPATGSANLTSIEGHQDGSDYIVTALYTGDMKSVRWRVRSSGWVQADYEYTASGPHDYFGVSFDYPDVNVEGMTWLGNGPYRAWQNRIAAGSMGVWSNIYNNTMTGDSGFRYPEFKGYYADVRWATLKTAEGPITIVPGQDNVFLQMLTPKFPANAINARTPFPAADISLLNSIPAIGNKFHRAADTGPDGKKAVGTGEYQGSVSIYFGELTGS